MLEELKISDLGINKINVKIESANSKTDVSKFSLNDLKKYCEHNEIEVEGVKSKYVKAVWEYIEDQYDWETESDSESEEESESESESK